MQTIVKKWGNSASVRIPAPVMAAVAIDVHQTVDVRAEDGRIVIEPVRAQLYDLDDLLADMAPETFPDAVEFGAPLGEEAW